MISFDNRQIATFIWTVVIILTLFLCPKVRRVIIPSAIEVLKSLIKKEIIIPIIIYFLYAATIVMIAKDKDIWKLQLLVDTATIIFFVGLPTFLNAYKLKSGKQLFHKTIHDTIGVYTLIIFYVGLSPLSIIEEIILQFITGIMIIGSCITKNQKTRKILNITIAVIGLFLIIHTTNIILSTWDTENFIESLERLLLAIVLPILLVPSIYLFALIIRCQTLFKIINSFNKNTKMRILIKLTLVIRLKLQLNLLNGIGGLWLQKISECNNLKKALRTISRFKKAFYKQKRMERKRLHNLREMTNKAGVDQHGLQLDRREFYESKCDLKSLLYMQMGQFKNTFKHYNDKFPIEVAASRLPKNHGINMIVRKDKKAWYAWRKMPNGYYFGVGGSPNPNCAWCYNGDAQPSNFPGQRIKGWININTEQEAIEWQHYDGPIMLESPISEQ